MTGRARASVVAALVVTVGATVGESRVSPDPILIDFTRDIRPILSNNCFKCHGPDEATRQAGLRLDTRDGAVAALRSGAFAVTPGDPASSELLARVLHVDDGRRMPPPETGRTLSGGEIDLLRRWIEQGAEYQPHWAFVPPVRAEPPAVRQHDWPTNFIDHFVLSRLEREGLAPSPPSDRATLLRRLSLDLIGLPPTPEEVAAFERDERPDAYERVVDRLLASPHYGERWARVWLDQARYADTKGYEADRRRTIWPWRDWVIDALNADMPFDQFTLEQLAGDLLPDPSPSQLVATAFHRNTMNNDEGGTDDEEFRVAAVVDRVNTTMQTWMGLTMGCAQCHTHKYDPITQREYYQFYAAFNQTADADQPDESPTMAVITRDLARRLGAIDAELAEARSQLEAETPEIRAERERWIAAHAGRAVEWVTLTPEWVMSTHGAELTKLDDGSVLVHGASVPSDEYVISTSTSLRGMTALRLEVLPDDRLPGPGPGRTAHGNFVLTELLASAWPSGATHRAPRARFVRIDLPGSGRILSLAEVQVFSGLDNIAPSGRADQSSVDFEGDPSRAIDGVVNGRYEDNSVTHTLTETDPWWSLDLGEARRIEHLVIWNRTDGALHERLRGAHVTLLDDNGAEVWRAEITRPTRERLILDTAGDRLLRFSAAQATFSQSEWGVERAIDGDLRPGNASRGWAVGPHFGVPHQAMFTLADDLGFEAGVHLSFRLVQRYGTQHTIGRFRLSATVAPREMLSLPPEVASALLVSDLDRPLEQQRVLNEYFRTISTELAPLRERVARLEREREQLARSAPVMPVMRELEPERRRVTHIQRRGNHRDPGEVVEPDVPAALHPWPEGAPRDRRGIAAWLTSRENPLTARVAVNRFWEQLFGMGLVETVEDFGVQGALPTHPELLDALAVEFMNTGWSMKQLCRLIVTSATYRQSSAIDPAKLAIDPQNCLLSRGPRFRLEAEMIRDQALAVSGLLDAAIGGPPVFPPQPEGVWSIVYSDDRWVTTDADRHRRGLYTFWRRTSPYPSMMTFDAGSRESCLPRRLRTNTPLQAFVTLNDPVYVEAAQALARRMMREGGADGPDRVRRGVQLCLLRDPTGQEMTTLLLLYKEARADLAARPDDAERLAGALPRDGLDVIDLAAWTAVANVLLNLDEFLTKN